jgi:hypothetical protein
MLLGCDRCYSLTWSITLHSDAIVAYTKVALIHLRFSDEAYRGACAILFVIVRLGLNFDGWIDDGV